MTAEQKLLQGGANTTMNNFNNNTILTIHESVAMDQTVKESSPTKVLFDAKNQQEEEEELQKKIST